MKIKSLHNISFSDQVKLNAHCKGNEFMNELNKLNK